jgi:hypothetical protein
MPARAFWPPQLCFLAAVSPDAAILALDFRMPAEHIEGPFAFATISHASSRFEAHLVPVGYKSTGGHLDGVAP